MDMLARILRVVSSVGSVLRYSSGQAAEHISCMYASVCSMIDPYQIAALGDQSRVKDQRRQCNAVPQTNPLARWRAVIRSMILEAG